MPTAQDVLNIAASQLGVHENPMGSNNIKYNTWYYGHPVSGGDYAWCAVYCLWCAMMAGDSDLLHTHSAYVPTMYAQMKAAGMGVSEGVPGDIVCFQFDTNLLDHVGIVERRLGPGTYQTIEGNTGDAVQRHTRSGEMYFCRPAYGQPTPPQPKREDEMSAYTFGNISKATLIDCYRGKYDYFVTTEGVTSNLVFTLTEHETGATASTAGQPNPPVGKSGPHDHNIQDILKQPQFADIKGSFKLEVSCNQAINVSIREVPKG